MRYYIVLAAAAACLSVPAAGSDGGSTPRNKDNDTVCRRAQGLELGSHLRRAPRICKTRAAWREDEEYTQRDFRARTGAVNREPEEPTEGNPLSLPTRGPNPPMN
jgi:hypothetical protein